MSHAAGSHRPSATIAIVDRMAETHSDERRRSVSRRHHPMGRMPPIRAKGRDWRRKASMIHRSHDHRETGRTWTPCGPPSTQRGVCDIPAVDFESALRAIGLSILAAKAPGGATGQLRELRAKTSLFFLFVISDACRFLPNRLSPVLTTTRRSDHRRRRPKRLRYRVDLKYCIRYSLSAKQHRKVPQ